MMRVPLVRSSRGRRQSVVAWLLENVLLAMISANPWLLTPPPPALAVLLSMVVFCTLSGQPLPPALQALA